MAEPIDYLKTYLSIDPSDYSAMEAQIAGDPIPERQQYYMPSYTPQVDLSQMPEMQLQPSTTVMPQEDDRYQSLMDEIESLKAQIAALEAGQAPVSEMPTAQETMVEPVVTEETMPAETIDDVMSGEDLGVVTEQPTTPMDDYLRDMEDREMQINLGGGLGTVSLPLPSQNTLAGIAPQIPNLEQITQGIEDLRNRMTAGGGKLEDFQIYKPPFELPTQQTQPIGMPVSQGLDYSKYLTGLTTPSMEDIIGNPMYEGTGEKMYGRYANIDPTRAGALDEPTPTIQDISPISQGVDSILFPPKASISPFPAPFNLRNQMIRQPMQFAGGGSLDASLQDLKSRLSM